MKEIRIGLIGTGFMGKAHVAAFKNVPLIFASESGVPVPEAVTDINAEAVTKFATEFGLGRILTSQDQAVWLDCFSI